MNNEDIKVSTEYDEAPEPLFSVNPEDIEEPDVPEDESNIAQFHNPIPHPTLSGPGNVRGASRSLTANFIVRIHWNVPVIGFTRSDIRISSGSINYFIEHSTGDNYSVGISVPPRIQDDHYPSGTITITIPAGVARSGRGVSNSSSSIRVTWGWCDPRDRPPPPPPPPPVTTPIRVTIGAGAVNIVNRTISWRVTLSHSGLTGFDTNDIINRRPSGATVAITGSGVSRVVTFSGFSAGASGTAIFTIRANAFTSLPSNTRNNVAVDAPTANYNFLTERQKIITATPGSGTLVGGTYRLVLKEDAFGTGKPAADVPSGIITLYTRHTITATPDDTVTSGTYRFVLKEDAFGTDRPNINIPSPSIMIGAIQRVTAMIEAGIIDVNDLSIYWPITLSNANLTDFTEADIINRVPATVMPVLSGSGVNRVLTFFGFNADDVGNSSFSIRANAFAASSLPVNTLNNFQIDSGTTAYDFPEALMGAPSVTQWIIPSGVQNSNFNIEMVFPEDIDLRTSSQTGVGRLDNRASASNADLTITGTGATGVSFNTITASTMSGLARRRFVVPIVLPTNGAGVFTLTLARHAIQKPGTTTNGPIETQNSPPIEYATGTAIPEEEGPSAEFTVPTAVQTGTTFDINANFTPDHVRGLTASDLTLTGTSGGSLIVMSEQFRLGLCASSGATLPSSLSPSNVTINQTKHSGIVAQGTITRQGSSDYYNLVLNRAIDVSTLLTGDITLSGLTNISVGAITAEDNIYRIRVTLPTNSQGTISLILDKNSVENFNGVEGPSIEQNTPSVPFNTRTEVLSIVPQRPRGTDIAELQNGANFWLIVFNRTLPANTFTAANRNTDFSAITSVGSATVGTPERLTTTTNWIVPVTYPSAGFGNTYFQLNSNAGSLSICEHRSDTYQFGSITIPEVEIGPSAEFTIPSGIQTGTTFDINADFTAHVRGLTASDFTITGTTGASLIVMSEQFRLTLCASGQATLPSSLSPSNITIDQTKHSGLVAQGTITRQGSSDNYNLVLNRAIDVSTLLSGDITLNSLPNISVTGITAEDNIYRIRVTPPTNREGTISLILDKESVANFNDEDGPVIEQNTPSVPFNTKTEIISIIPQQPQGTDVAQLRNGINYWLIVFNRTLPANTFTDANKGAAFDVVSNNGTVTVGTPARQSTTTNWIIPATYPSSDAGSTYFQLNDSAAGLSICEYRSDVYPWGTVVESADRPSAEFTIPSGIQTGTTFDVNADFTTHVRGLTASDLSITGITGGSLIVMSEQFRLTLTGTTFPSSLSPSNVTINQSRHSGVVAQGTITRQGTSGNYNLVLNRAIDVSTLSTSDITLSGVTGLTVNAITAEDNVYRIRVTSPTNVQGTVSLILDRNSVTDFSNVQGPAIEQNTPSIPVDTRTIVESITAEQPQGTRIARLRNGGNYFKVRFNRELATNTFTNANISTSFALVGTTGSIGTPARSATDTQEWFIPVTMPSAATGTVLFRVLENAGTLTSLRSFSSDVYPWGTPVIEADPPSADFTVPTAVQTGTTFDITANFIVHVTGLTASDFTITGTSGASLIVMSEQFRLTLTASSGATLPANMTPSNVTIDQTKHSGLVAQGTITRQGSSGNYNLVLNRAVDISTLLVGDITINNLPNISASAIEAEDSNYRIRVTPPSNMEGTLSLILDKNSVENFTNVSGPTIEQNTPSVPFNTKTEVISVVPQQPRGTDIAQLQNGINHWLIIFNRVLPTTTFTNANRNTDFSVISNTGTPTIGTPERLTTTTNWIVPVTYPDEGYGFTYFQLNNNAGSLTICEHRSETYPWGVIDADFEAGPSITEWIIPDGIQTSNFNIEILFSENIDLRTDTETDVGRLDNRASASNADITITGTGNTGVSFGEITASTMSGLTRRRFIIPVTLPANSSGIFNLTLSQGAVVTPGTTDSGPVELQTSPSIEFNTRTEALRIVNIRPQILA